MVGAKHRLIDLRNPLHAPVRGGEPQPFVEPQCIAALAVGGELDQGAAEIAGAREGGVEQGLADALAALVSGLLWKCDLKEIEL